MPRKPSAPTPVEDVVLVHGKTDDGAGLKVIRKRADTISAGEVRPVGEGKPIHGELVSLRPREGAPYLLDVDVLHGGAEAPSAGGAEARAVDGPAKVATEAYRAGWNSVFGRRRRATNALN